MGQLSRPSIPNIPGMSGGFAGPSFHSANWDHDLNLSGKRIAVVGTGASAVQFVPVVAACAAHLDVFQRSAPWVLPKFDRQYGGRHHQLLRKLPILRLSERLMIWTIFEFLALALVDAKPVARVLGGVALRHLGRQVHDARLRSQLTPDYAPGCKRILFSSDYYPALARPNVALVTDDIEAVEPGGIRTVDGEFHAADVIIYGTGFSATEFLSPPMEVHGRSDRTLSDVWADGAHAYYGLSVPDFPNFLMMYGPNTNVGSGSIVYMLESQARHIVRLMKVLRAIREVSSRCVPTWRSASTTGWVAAWTNPCGLCARAGIARRAVRYPPTGPARPSCIAFVRAGRSGALTSCRVPRPRTRRAGGHPSRPTPICRHALCPPSGADSVD